MMYRAAIIANVDSLGIIIDRDGDVGITVDSIRRRAEVDFETAVAIARVRGWTIHYLGQVSGEIISGGKECQIRQLRFNDSI